MVNNPAFIPDLLQELWEGVLWVVSRTWGWGIALFLYGIGVNAMFGDQYIVASALYFAAILIAGIKVGAEAKADGKKFGTLLIIVVAALVVFIASLWWVKHTHEMLARQPDATPAIIAWVWAHTLYARSLPWRWILGSIATGFLFASIVNVIRGRQNLASASEGCPARWLHAIAENDRSEIQNAVTVSGIQFRNEIETGKRYVDFVFSIFNKSVYEISIDDEIKGDIIFDGEILVTEKRMDKNRAQNCHVRGSGYFTVRQFLNTAEIDSIKNATGDKTFRLEGLFIMIKGGADYPQVVRKPLKIEACSLSKENPTYIDYFGPSRARFDPESTLVSQAVAQRESVDVTPTFVFLETKSVVVYSEDNGRIVKWTNVPRSAPWRTAHPTYRVIIASYHNQPSAAQKPVNVKAVSAQLTYKLSDGPLIIPRAQWFPENIPTINFAYNDEHGFILAVVSGGNRIIALQNGEFVDLRTDEAEVSVQLISEASGMIKDAGRFELIHIPEPNLDIKVLKLD
jgi:hypothetical protein